MEGKIKFIYVLICFCVSLTSLKHPISKRDSLLLVAAMFFTLISDFSLLILDNYILGVFTFCFTHIAYIFRNRNDRDVKRYFFLAAALFFVAGIFFGILEALCAAYACFFGANLYLGYTSYKSERLPKINGKLILYGTVLFALCDINVFLFNLRLYTENSIIIDTISPTALVLIWVFYVPSQAMLALSGINYDKEEAVF